jgi:energy-coupling factor transporter ATP-binding protein EcfA2
VSATEYAEDASGAGDTSDAQGSGATDDSGSKMSKKECEYRLREQIAWRINALSSKEIEALVAFMWSLQDDIEQLEGESRIRNARGVNQYDAPTFAAFMDTISQAGQLTPEQIEHARVLLPWYWKQLIPQLGGEDTLLAEYAERVPTADLSATITMEYNGERLGELHLRAVGKKVAVSIVKNGKYIEPEKTRFRDFYRTPSVQKDLFGRYEADLGEDYADFIMDIGRAVENEYANWDRCKTEQKTPQPNNNPETIPPDAVLRAESLIKSGEALEFVADLIEKLHKGDRDIAKLLWLSMIVIRLRYRIHWLLVGSSGSGKSDLSKSVCAVIPDENKVQLDECSPKAIYYAAAAGKNLSFVVIFIDDVEPDDGTVNTLKALASDERGTLRKWVVDGSLKFKEMEIPEDIIVVATTIESLTDKQGQLLRRYQIVNPDESKEQLQEVKAAIKKDMRIPKDVAKPELDDEILTAKAIYRAIVQNTSDVADVAIPFDFDYQVEQNPDKTSLKAFSTLVKAFALLNYPNRMKIGPIILAIDNDFEEAVELWHSIRALKIDAVAEKVLNKLPSREPIFKKDANGDIIYNYDASRSLASNIAADLNISPRTVQEKLQNLYDVGLTDRKKVPLQGRPYANWRVGNRAAPIPARITKETRESDVVNMIMLLTDKYGGDPVELYGEYENICKKESERWRSSYDAK